MDVQLQTSVKVSAEFFNEAGVLFDPTVVTCKVKTPDGLETSYVYGTDVALVKDSTGNYHLWITTATPGRYAYRFKGTGTVNVANERTFNVSSSVFTTP